MPLTVQTSAPGARSGHVIIAGHSFVMSGLHATSHLHAFGQLTLPHAPAPVHVASHMPVPQVSVPHAAAPPLHVVLQSLAAVHVTLLHAALPMQFAVQLPPDCEHDRLPQAALP